MGISDHLKQILFEDNPDENGCTFAESIARRIAENAAKGNQGAIECARDTTEGRPGQAAKNQAPTAQVEQEISTLEINLINDL